MQPLSLVTFKVTVKLPAVLNVTKGLCAVDCVPLPKSQSHATLLLPAPGLERSVNCTLNGKHPEVGVPEKFTVGGSYTVIYWLRVRVLDPAALVTVSLIV